jgi:hypothetical protein
MILSLSEPLQLDSFLRNKSVESHLDLFLLKLISLYIRICEG